jgi:hypothetical protein
MEAVKSENEGDLARAVRRVRDGRMAVARQQVQVVRLRAAGRSTLDAQQTLGAIITTLAIFEEHEKALRAAQIQTDPSCP